MAKITWKNALDEAKITKVTLLNNKCEETIMGRFKAPVGGTIYEFSYDMQAQSRFNGVANLFAKGIVTQIEWTAYLNGERTRVILNATDFDNVSIAALSHCDGNIKKYNGLRQQVVDAQDLPTLEAIIW